MGGTENVECWRSKRGNTGEKEKVEKRKGTVMEEEEEHGYRRVGEQRRIKYTRMMMKTEMGWMGWDGKEERVSSDVEYIKGR